MAGGESEGHCSGCAGQTVGSLDVLEACDPLGVHVGARKNASLRGRR